MLLLPPGGMNFEEFVLDFSGGSCRPSNYTWIVIAIEHIHNLEVPTFFQSHIHFPESNARFGDIVGMSHWESPRMRSL